MNMPKISDYSFGKMQINQQIYTSDLIIFPNGRIQDNWRRKDGHMLRLKDIEQILLSKPQRIIAGTGASGRMVAATDVKPYIAGRGIEFVALPTAEATAFYNKKKDADIRVCACFHLTC